MKVGPQSVAHVFERRNYVNASERHRAEQLERIPLPFSSAFGGSQGSI